MSSKIGRDVVEILARASSGDTAAYNELFPLVMDQLHMMAQSQLRHERPDHTLQPTALVNEAYLRITDLNQMSWQDRSHFLAVASGIMRRILVDSARARKRIKRGGDARRVDIETVQPSIANTEDTIDIERLDMAIQKLAALQPRQARVVEMRYFGGATHTEIAEVLGVSRRTVDVDWRMAREILREFYEHGDAESC